MILLAGATPSFAQEHQLRSTSSFDDGALQVSPQLSRYLDKSSLSEAPDFIERHGFEISGPAVRPFKGKGFWAAPKRFLQAFYPFGHRNRESVQKAPVESLPHLSATAWTTTVGWHPTYSGLNDPLLRCDGGWSLVSFGK